MFNHTLVSVAKADAEVSALLNLDMPELREFVDAVAKAMPNMKFTPRSSDSAWVYRDDCPYCVGWIGVTPYETLKYTISSRLIVNQRFRKYDDYYHTKSSARMETSVKNAKKLLMVYSTREIAQVRLKQAAHLFGSETETVLGRATGIFRKYIHQPRMHHKEALEPTLITELRYLVSSGYEFMNKEFAADLKEYLTLVKMLRAEKDSVRRGKFVYRTPTHVSVVAIDHIDNHWRGELHETVTYHDPETLPMDIQEKIAMLDMLPDGDFVAGVGYVAGEGMYYIADEEDE